MTVLLIGAVLMRIVSLDDRGLSKEELVTLCLVNGHPTGPFGELIDNADVPDRFVRKDLRDRKTYSNVVHATITANGNSVLYHLILSWWTKAFGNTNFALRFVSLFFGAMTVILGYYFARQLFSERVAVLTAVMLCLHPLLLEYSQLARAYMPAGFFILLSTYSLYQVSVAKKHNWLHIPLYSIASLAALMTHYLVIYILIAHLLLLIFFHGQKKAFLQYGIMGLIVIVLFTFWWFNGGEAAKSIYVDLLVNTEGKSFGWNQKGDYSLPVNVWYSLDQLFGLKIGVDAWFGWLYMVLLIPATALIFALLKIRKSEYFRPAMFVLVPLIAQVFLMLCTSVLLGNQFLFEPEYFSFAIPFACLLVAFGIDRLLLMGGRFTWIGYAIAVVMIGMMSYSSILFYLKAKTDYSNSDPFIYHKAASFVEDESAKSDTIVFSNRKHALITNIYMHKSFDNIQLLDTTLTKGEVIRRNGTIIDKFFIIEPK